MKKVSMVLLFTLITIISFGQYRKSNVDGILYYGTTNKLGFEVNVTTKTNLIIGGGLTIDLNRGGIGKDYSNTMGPNAFREEIYNIRVVDNASLYGTIGYTYNDLSFGGKLGFGGATKYFNAYDDRQILSPGGYYFTATDGGSKILLGVFVSYKLEKNISPYFGFDTFNGVNIGVSFRY